MNEPRMAATFAVDLNPDIDPWLLSKGSQKRIWWRCTETKCEHHIWCVSVATRLKATGCPFCVGKRTCRCSSFMNDPQLADSYDHELNKDVDPWAISIYSGKRLWWKCSTRTSCRHHVWEAALNNLSKSTTGGCPYCSGQRTCPCDSFMTNALLASQFDYTLNKDINPYELSHRSNKVVWWRCPLAPCSHHVWPAPVNSRTNGHGCSYCSGHKGCPCTSFMNNPILMAEFDASLNLAEDPYTISRMSGKHLNWKCTVCANIWRTMVAHRSQGQGCPECARTREESKGSQLCREYLESHKIPYMREAKLQYLESRRYDFIFSYQGCNYALEFDGEQHFRESNWHATTAAFLENQEIDKVKNCVALAWGYNVLRISSREPTHVTATLDFFLQIESKEPFFGVDVLKAYRHMFSPIPPETMHKHCPRYPELIATTNRTGSPPSYAFS